jgi:hypothetical protein
MPPLAIRMQYPTLGHRMTDKKPAGTIIVAGARQRRARGEFSRRPDLVSWISLLANGECVGSRGADSLSES